MKCCTGCKRPSEAILTIANVAYPMCSTCYLEYLEYKERLKGVARGKDIK